MVLHICMDYAGNVHITDFKDALPTDAVDYHEVVLTDYKRHKLNDNRTMHIEVQDYSEIITLGGIAT